MITIKTEAEIELMKKANKIVAETRETLREAIKPGVTTRQLDKKAEKLIRKQGAIPAFKGYQGFPSTICASLNDQVVHGIPNDQILKEGDVLSIDLGAIWKGFYGDSAITCAVGHISDKAQRLLKITEESLYKGIDAAQPNARLHDIGAAVQEHVEQAGYSVVREFVGHGIGQALHEDPQIPNYGTRGTGPQLKVGMVIAIEPMVNAGDAGVEILEDGWTAVTKDGSLSAHFEHTLAILPNGPEILTTLQ